MSLTSTIKIVINSVKDGPLKADILVVTSLLAEKILPADVVNKLIRREKLMESQLLKEWTRLEREEAAEAATAAAAEAASIKKAQQIIANQLGVKFGLVPGRIIKQIENITELMHLDYLTRQIITVNTLDEFAEHVEQALNIH